MEDRFIKPLAERYLEELTVEGNLAKVTINPCTGRVTLKIPTTATEDDKICFHFMAVKVMEYENYKPYTYRGKIKDNNLVIKTESPLDSVYFEYP